MWFLPTSDALPGSQRVTGYGTGIGVRPDLVRQIASTRSAADSGFSHSQTHSTTQPAASSSVRCRRSLCPFDASFAAHHPALILGLLPCSGQECQKSPITNTAILARVRTMSGRTRPMSRCTRNLRPSANSALRRASSGPVSRVRCLLICLRTSSLLAAGVDPTTRSSLMASDPGWGW